MRFVLVLVSIAVFTACGGSGSDNEPYDTYQACYDDHHTVESLPSDQAITTCCIYHPIGSAKMNTVCGNDAAACMTYLTANLSSSTTVAEITAGCNLYISQRGM